MNKSDIVIGKTYGYRSNPRRRSELERVKVIESARGQWKIEWVEPNPGLVAFVKSTNLIVRWKDAKPLLRDERLSDRLEAANDSKFLGRDHPVSDAVDRILSMTGEDVWVANQGDLSGNPDALRRIADRAKVEYRISPPGFVDRDGTAHLPFQTAVELATAFAAAEPGEGSPLVEPLPMRVLLGS